MTNENLEERIERLKKEFVRIYGAGEIRIVVSPYRICPLGAHVDHQDGVVTGFALDNSIVMVYRPDPDGYVHLHSKNFPDSFRFHLKDKMTRKYDWCDYARGAVTALSTKVEMKIGIEALLDGDMPIGGLSSSAAVGVAYLMALEDVNEMSCSMEENIELDRLIENRFIGVNNGILDQSVIILAQKGSLLRLDCSTREFERVKRAGNMPEFDILVVYSGVKKTLVDTDYNKRVEECQMATQRLLELSGRPPAFGANLKLRMVTAGEFREHAMMLNRIQRKRAEHFFTENERVEKGMEAWSRGDLVGFGEQMRLSGDSSINNYECGCPPLIALTEILNGIPGVHGVRFSGAGFRGSCIGASDPAARDDIRAVVAREYPARFPEYENSFEVRFSRPASGAYLV